VPVEALCLAAPEGLGVGEGVVVDLVLRVVHVVSGTYPRCRRSGVSVVLICL
jgi:hypothetical protein